MMTIEQKGDLTLMIEEDNDGLDLITMDELASGVLSNVSRVLANMPEMNAHVIALGRILDAVGNHPELTVNNVSKYLNAMKYDQRFLGTTILEDLHTLKTCFADYSAHSPRALSNLEAAIVANFSHKGCSLTV